MPCSELAEGFFESAARPFGVLGEAADVLAAKIWTDTSALSTGHHYSPYPDYYTFARLSAAPV